MEITKKETEQLIELRKDDTYLNHLKTIFTSDFRPIGEIGQNEIKIWRQNMWNKVFYPIFIFEFNANNHLIKISDKLNPIGKIIIGLAICGILYSFIPKNIDQFNFVDNWLYITIFWSFFPLVGFVLKKFYASEKKNQLQQIFEFLEIEYEKPKPEKEWSLKNILIRFFTYPFSIFIIVICIWGLFEQGSIFFTIFGIGVCGGYLVMDIKMIIREKKTTTNSGYAPDGKSSSVDK